MALIEPRLDGIYDRVAIAVERLRSFEPEEGYYLAFSGGKDSITLKALADEAGVKYDAHYSVTTVDPPELLRFMREHHNDVAWDRPPKTMIQLVVHDGGPPTRLIRYCCRALKERCGEGRKVLTGIRWAESPRRKNTRKLVEPCYSTHRSLVNPIIDWGDDDVWEFIRDRNLPYCSLYDEGFKRLGCVMCPMGNKRGMERDAARWPRFYVIWLRTFDLMLKKRDEMGKETIWQNAQEVMDWWIYGKQKEPEGQMTLFE